MRIIQLFLVSLLIAVSPFASFAAQGGGASVRAILVIGSNTPGASDPRLGPYEPILKANLVYKSYRFADEKSATVAAGATTAIQLAGGNQVELIGEKSGPNMTVKVRRGGTTTEVSRGHPVVLVGGKSGNAGDVYAIIVFVN